MNKNKHKTGRGYTMTKNQENLREIKFDENLGQLIYARSPRAKKALPYNGTRISGVEDFSEESQNGEREEAQQGELEKKLRAKISSRARTLKADAYEIVSTWHDNNDEELSLYEQEYESDERPRTYFADAEAIFYRKNQ